MPADGAIRKGYVDTERGQVHYAECRPRRGGDAPAVVLLHQTPRSWDEYREVLPLLGRTHRAIAMDTIGFGASAHSTDHSIENYAATTAQFIEGLGLSSVAVVGHHTGGLIGIELAARAPDVVDRLVLSCTPYTDESGRATRAARPPVDHVEVASDGSHLPRLWQRRQAFYPPDRPDILTRFVRDALLLGADLEAGHRACADYRLEDRIGSVDCPVLVIAASSDTFTFGDAKPLAANFRQADMAVVAGGMVPLMEQRPVEIAGLIGRFVT